MDSTRTYSERQQAVDWDFPSSRSYYPESIWFRGKPRRRQSSQPSPVPPLVRDQVIDALRQELAGWKSSARNWEGRCARVEQENANLQRLLDVRQNRNGAPAAYLGVQEDHVGKTK